MKFVLLISLLWVYAFTSVISVDQRSYYDLVRELESFSEEDLFQIVRESGLAQIVDFGTAGKIKDMMKPHPIGDSPYLPVVQMHGMGDFANDPFGMVPLKRKISAELDGAYVLNVQIGPNSLADILNGFFMNLDDTVDYFASVVQSDVNLVGGFNAIGYSQGNLIIRGYIEKYNSPPVQNWISMHGPLMGVAGIPGCNMTNTICQKIDGLLYMAAYTAFVQQHLTQANYFRDPTHLDDYYANDKFLADINNEDGSVDEDYVTNLTSLETMVLIKASADTMVWPNDSEWYGYFQDGSQTEKWETTETPWYQDNRFGLQTMMNNNQVVFNMTEGDHLEFTTDYLLGLVDEYFK
jgi:palmitoyl-protein thioesterase